MNNVRELVEYFTSDNLEEGIGWTQTKHTVGANIYLSFQKLKKKLGLKHSYDRKTINDINEARLKDIVDSANDREDLQEVIATLSRWYNAASKDNKIIADAKDSNDIKNHNKAVILGVTRLNKKYLDIAKTKLVKLK